jgi:thymidine kinase
MINYSLYIHLLYIFYIQSIFYLIKLKKNRYKYYTYTIYKMNHLIQIISIEGNIGSGKSTLLANLKEHFGKNTNVIFLKEPVDEWGKIKDKNGTTILEKFYADQEKYSFPFQMMAYISRLKILKDTISQIKTSPENLIKERSQQDNYFKLPEYIIITERSLFTDKMVFAKMLYDTGKIEDVNYQIYLNWFDTFAQEFSIDKIIYVKTDPEICQQRIGKRLREGEDKIPLDYLKSCSEYHDIMMDKTSSECVCKNQLVLNGNHDTYENKTILQQWIDSIHNFIYN